jgi:hypothetical protein
MHKGLKDLVDLLLNSKASIADRDDAAMDLFEYDNDTALNALIKVADYLDHPGNPVNFLSEGKSVSRLRLILYKML